MVVKKVVTVAGFLLATQMMMGITLDEIGKFSIPRVEKFINIYEDSVPKLKTLENIGDINFDTYKLKIKQVIKDYNIVLDGGSIYRNEGKVENSIAEFKKGLEELNSEQNKLIIDIDSKIGDYSYSTDQKSKLREYKKTLLEIKKVYEEMKKEVEPYNNDKEYGNYIKEEIKKIEKIGDEFLKKINPSEKIKSIIGFNRDTSEYKLIKKAGKLSWSEEAYLSDKIKEVKEIDFNKPEDVKLLNELRENLRIKDVAEYYTYGDVEDWTKYKSYYNNLPEIREDMTDVEKLNEKVNKLMEISQDKFNSAALRILENRLDIENLKEKIGDVSERTEGTSNNNSGNVNLDAKADKVDVYTKAEVDGKYATKKELETKANINSVYTKEQTDGKYATKEVVDTKANKTEVKLVDDKVEETKVEIAKLEEKKADKVALASLKEELDKKLNERINGVVVGKEVDVYTKEEADKKFATMEKVEANKIRIEKTEERIKKLEREYSNGISQVAAMTAMDFQVLEVGEAGIGAALGSYGKSQSISLGVSYRPTSNFYFNGKVSTTPGKGNKTAVGIGGVYKFRVGK